MTETTDHPQDQARRIRRLLVTLDPSAGCLNALDELATLATHLEVELRGLFVEDTDFLDLAGHRVVTTYPPRTQSPLAPEAIERTMRHHVDQARRAVQATSERRRLPMHFEVRRGRTAFEVVQSAGDDDLIVISRYARGFTTTHPSASLRAGPTAREVVRETPRSVFVLSSAGSLSGPLYVAFDGTSSSAQALELAADVAARSQAKGLVVLILSADDAEANDLRRIAEVKIAAHGVSATYETVEQGGLENLCRAVSARDEGVLVMGGEQRVLQDGGVQDLLEHVGCSVLLVR